MTASPSEQWDQVGPFDTDSESEDDTCDAVSPDQVLQKPSESMEQDAEPDALPLSL